MKSEDEQCNDPFPEYFELPTFIGNKPLLICPCQLGPARPFPQTSGHYRMPFGPGPDIRPIKGHGIVKWLKLNTKFCTVEIRCPGLPFELVKGG